jgi:hypothetical protein
MSVDNNDKEREKPVEDSGTSTKEVTTTLIQQCTTMEKDEDKPRLVTFCCYDASLH